jgi:glutathione S-transferase
MVELLGLPFSPWSEKARWALEARHVPFGWRTFSPIVGEPALRFKLGKWSGRVTVPVLTDDEGRAIGDSAEIARWADRRGDGPAMYPRGREAEVARFVSLSERGLDAGRALALRRILRDDAALAEMAPKPLRKALGPLSSAIGRFGIRRTLRKYGTSGGGAADYEAPLAGILEELRGAVASAPPSANGDEGAARGVKTLLGVFSFADIAMAQVLAFVDPPKFGLRIAPSGRRAFRDDALAERFADLIAWRDGLYEAYRPR